MNSLLTSTGSGKPPTAPESAEQDGGGHPLAGPTPRTHRGRWAYAVIAVLTYLPMLLTKPGVVSDDTKTYLYLDPGKWIRTSASVWDPNVALGSVTHETIGYLFPMGPYYWAMALVHVPTWVAQRLWLGSIVFVAGAGVLYLADTIGLTGPGRLIAATAYAFTPYVLQYSGRISVILMPYAGLPLLLALVIQAVRHRGWKYPALFALVVAAVSGINASSIIYVGIAPVLWLPFVVLVAGEATGKRAVGTLVRVGLLSVLASLWWIVGLAVEGAFGINVLRYTESVQATSSTSNASDVIRGLGYWYFYGGDRMGLWTASASELTQKLWLIALTYVLPVVAVVSAALARWRYRIYFVALVAIGLVLSVGAYPYDHPTAFGGLAKAFMTKTTAGLALRSTDRATPLVVLGLAVLAGMGVSALAARFRGIGLAALVVVGGCLLLADVPFFAGRTVISQFSQPATPPKPVTEAAAHLNATHPGTRVYALPGNNFAAERWGDTIDPVWPALLDRPFVTREQQIQGSLPTADLLYALDAPLQQGTMDWNALAPVARLMSVGDILVDYDQQYERYDTPRPTVLAQQLATTPPGLSDPVSFGQPVPNLSTIPQLDETYYGLPTDLPTPAPIVTYTVANPRPIVRGESTAHPLIIDGDAVGVVDAADAGLLASDPTIFYAGTLAKDKTLGAVALHGPADLVVTDSNRKQAFEWNSLNDNTGYTETATEQPTSFVQNDPAINLFPGMPSDTQTTSILQGIASVTASAYGTATTLRSEWRPANAIDGNPTTAWETEGDSGVPNGNWWQVTLDHPTTTSSVTLLQPQPVANQTDYTNQWITEATLTFDGKDPVTVDLGPGSRAAPGQVVSFSARSFKTLRVTIDQTNLSNGSSVPAGSSLVGLAEVGIGQTRVTQIVKVPSDLVQTVGKASADDRLTYIFTRDRVAPVPPRQSPEVALARQFEVATPRGFALTGTARLATAAPDDQIDRLVGRAGGTSGLLSATSSSRMPGDLESTAGATVDGNPSTAWSPGIGAAAQSGAWLDYAFAAPVTVDHLDLQVVSDAEHSRPTSVTVTGTNGSQSVPLPAIPVTAGAGSTTTVPVSFPAVTGTNLRITFDGIAEQTTASYETSLTDVLPIAVAEIGIPGVSGTPLPTAIPPSCRSDLLTLDGKPVWVSVAGTTADALAGNGLDATLCGPDAGGLTLGAGTHRLMAADGAVTGFNIDQLVLDSAPATPAGPAPLAASANLPPTPSASTGAPTVSVTRQSATTIDARVTGATGPFLLVLGQSINRGWSATVAGAGDLGPPTLVDGFANGWYVDRSTLTAASHDGSFDVRFRFTPQATVNVALIISGATVLACVVVVVAAALARRRRRRGTAATTTDVDSSIQPAAPSLVPLRSEHRRFVRSRPVPVVVGTVLAGAVALALGGVFAGVVTAVGVLVAMTLASGRLVLRMTAIALMAAGAADIVVHQARYHYPPGGWPTQFNRASALIWGAVMLLAADAALSAVRRVRAHRAPTAAGNTGNTGGSGETEAG